MAESLDERRARLGAEIEAARAEFAARSSELDGPEIGDVIDALSHELNDLTDLERNDHAAAHARCDVLEAKLAATRARLGAKG